MRRLFILYDSECGLCTWARNWLSRQPAYLELVFVPAGSEWAGRLFPQLPRQEPVDELVVVSDEGGVYRSDAAWIMCLFALQEYREWGMRLAQPHLAPFARQAIAFLSRNRGRVSRWLRLESEAELVASLRQVFVPTCSRTEFSARAPQTPAESDGL
ncbi:thiol-disulfide oxidoreductase DCC family protein [Singulisphaera sp. PoT]|uniref:thiol-disulfide oxidoreductase DCC family protein n=1 Tax=Singulisphaera sp. PoT TaxID=3411797 RepID=UPI003BF526D8